MDISINYFAVLTAAIANMGLGFLWYGPIFGKLWIKLMGFSEEKIAAAKSKGMTKKYSLMIISTLVMVFVLAHFAKAWNAQGIQGAFELAFWIWLGFIAPTFLGSVLWEERPWALYGLNVGFYLVSLFISAVILVFWI